MEGFGEVVKDDQKIGQAPTETTVADTYMWDMHLLRHHLRRW